MTLSKICILTFLADMSIVNFISSKPQFILIWNLCFICSSQNVGGAKEIYVSSFFSGPIKRTGDGLRTSRNMRKSNKKFLVLFWSLRVEYYSSWPGHHVDNLKKVLAEKIALILGWNKKKSSIYFYYEKNIYLSGLKK